MNTNKADSLFVIILAAVLLLSVPFGSLDAASSDYAATDKVVKIVIDPGHGGKAPGGVGPNGEKEKDITLEMGRALAKLLADEGMEVLLTRDDDRYIPLEERTAFANRNKADLFVSIHVNATDSRSTDGIETYFLNLTTDAASNRVAQRENAMTSESMQGLQLIIRDLMLNARINESSRFATLTHNAVVASLRKTGYSGRDHGVKQAPFYVLMGAGMPAILIETGFITNASDCALLFSSSHQETIVEGIREGIRAFLMNSTYVFNSGVQEAATP